MITLTSSGYWLPDSKTIDVSAHLLRTKELAHVPYIEASALMSTDIKKIDDTGRWTVVIEFTGTKVELFGRSYRDRGDAALEAMAIANRFSARAHNTRWSLRKAEGLAIFDKSMVGTVIVENKRSAHAMKTILTLFLKDNHIEIPERSEAMSLDDVFDDVNELCEIINSNCSDDIYFGEVPSRDLMFISVKEQ